MQHDVITIVDEHDTPIGEKARAGTTHNDIYRVAALWLTDAQTGDVLITQRKFTKKHDPGKWASAVSGTVESHETYAENIAKETAEEIGLTGLAFTPGPKQFCDDGLHRYFCQWFTATVDKNAVTIVTEEDAIETYKWVSRDWLFDDVTQNPQNYVPSMTGSLTPSARIADPS